MSCNGWKLLLAALAFACPPLWADRLEGFADMHTHPMSHLAFGGMILYGAPDAESLMLATQKYRGWHFGAKNCNETNERAGSVEGALQFDNALHGGPGFGTTTFGDANNCGDAIRTAVIDNLEEKFIYESRNPGLLGQVNDHPHHGYPAFPAWPHWSSVTHQQMYWEWIRRAHQGGLRVMVALAVNNSLLAKAANASQFVDDRSSVELQLREIISFAGRHGDFMEIARSPQDLRRIVRSGRLAVVLGVETDDFGNLSRRQYFDGETIDLGKVGAEIDRLYSLGVRYILPIHFANSVLGGYAINKDLFALSSKEYTNRFPQPAQTCNEGIHFALDRAVFSGIESHALRTRDLGRIIDAQPAYVPPCPGCGHKNSVGLTALGRGALDLMMRRGLMIDVDHMSALAVEEALSMAESRDYPLSSGHNGPLADECLTGGSPDCAASERRADPHLKHCTESQRTSAQYLRIRALAGMVGLGHGGRATRFVPTYRKVLELMGNRPIAIGTDANGLETLPEPDPLAPVRYDASFTRSTLGSRAWDVNSRIDAGGREVGDGVAHYGLLPDYIRSWQTSADPATRMTARANDAFMSSAEGFARTWEKTIRRSDFGNSPRTERLVSAVGWCLPPAASLYQGDFNGDGMTDLLCREGNLLGIDLATGSGVVDGRRDWSIATSWCTHAGATLLVGDFDGDGRSDLLCRDRTRMYIDYADEREYFRGHDWWVDSTWCTHAGASLHLADFDGDGRTDLLCRDRERFYVDYADPRGQFAGHDWFAASAWCTHSGATLQAGDLDGDGRADLLCHDPNHTWANYADASGHFAERQWASDSGWCSTAGSAVVPGDFDGDGRADLLCLTRRQLIVHPLDPPSRFRIPGLPRRRMRTTVIPAGTTIDLADAEGHFAGTDWSAAVPWCDPSEGKLIAGDFNGDGRADLLCRSSSGFTIDYATSEGRFAR